MSADARGAVPRWLGISGLVSVTLVVVAFVVGSAPEADATDARILDYYTDDANQAKQMVAAILLSAAIVALVVFVAGMRRVLLGSSASPALADVAFASGLAAAVLAVAGWAIGTAVPATFVFSDTFELDANTARVVLTIGNIWLLTFAGAVGSAFVAAVSLASRQTGTLPAWLAWTGLVLAPLMVLAIPLFGLTAFILGLWVLAVSIGLLLRSRASATA